MATTKLQLRTALGPVYRDVLPNPPRDCTPEEIPIIDLDPLFSPSLSQRKALASQIRSASINNGFFYIKNHRIPSEIISTCRQQVLNFMRQPLEKKLLLDSRTHSKNYNGYLGVSKTQISPTENPDLRESFAFRYSPEMDPDHPLPLSELHDESVKSWIRGEEFVWEGGATSDLPNFKRDCIAYWSECLTLARRLVRIFALSLDLDEGYWDEKVTFPGADGVFNYYPPRSREEEKEEEGKVVGGGGVNLGSHTDLQLFTLLWQDYQVGGLQVLTREGQWIKAPPVEGTFVVNIGDFMMRLCNDRYKSTVHRVVTNESTTVERISMPFFFGLNFNCVEGVVPSCTSEDNPARYEPISCGEWCMKRFKIERDEYNKKQEEKGSQGGIEDDVKAAAPSAVVVEG